MLGSDRNWSTVGLLALESLVGISECSSSVQQKIAHENRLFEALLKAYFRFIRSLVIVQPASIQVGLTRHRT